MTDINAASCPCQCHGMGAYATCSVDGGCGYLHASSATPRTDQRTLRELHDLLRTACADLVDPVPREVTDPWDGSVAVHETDSLLTQLEDAAGSSSMSGGGPSKSQPIPIDPDAVDLYREIEATTAEWCTEATVELRIRTGVNLAGQWTAEADVHWVLGRLERWVTQIREHFNPKPRYHLAAPCPACGKRMAWRKDETTGETVQRPALDLQQVGEGAERNWECACLACGHRWPHGNLDHLALVIAQERAEAITRVPGEPLALWRDGSVHRLTGSNMAGPVKPLADEPEGGSAA